MPSLDAPVPLAATISAATGLTTITFSVPLVAGALDLFNWSILSSILGPPRILLPLADPIAAGVDVTFFAGDAGPAIPGEVINYSPPPFDVVSDFGFVDAPAFADFPLVTVP